MLISCAAGACALFAEHTAKTCLYRRPHRAANAAVCTVQPVAGSLSHEFMLPGLCLSWRGAGNSWEAGVFGPALQAWCVGPLKLGALGP